MRFALPAALPALLLAVLALLCPSVIASTEKAVSTERASEPTAVPVLCYHRFGPTVTDSMTVTTPVFESHLKFLRDNGYTVIPLQAVIDYRLGKAPAPPPRSVVITVDDGHRTVYDDMLPLVQQYKIPVTLFIYPSAISNASYAMTWDELKMLTATGLFTVQSHTYWHPNFKREKKKLSPAEYDKVVNTQLQRSKAVLEKRMGTSVTALAWPFGIYDDELLARAEAAGYVAAFSIDGRAVGGSDPMFSLPRFLMMDKHRGKVFAGLVASAAAPARNSVARQ